MLVEQDQAALGLAEHVPETWIPIVKQAEETRTLLSPKEIMKRANPTRLERALRESFWVEYEKCMQRDKRRVLLVNVYEGICSVSNFQRVMKNANKAAFILTPVRSYEREIDAILSHTTDRLWELSQLDFYTRKKNGRKEVNVPIARLVFDVIKMVQDRAKGMAVQRIATKNENVNTTVKVNQSIELMDDRIKELSGELNKTSLPLPEDQGSDEEVQGSDIVDGSVITDDDTGEEEGVCDAPGEAEETD